MPGMIDLRRFRWRFWAAILSASLAFEVWLALFLWENRP